jgi:hypothetical protein
MMLLWSGLAAFVTVGAYGVWRWWHRPVRFPDPVSNHHEARERFPGRKT